MEDCEELDLDLDDPSLHSLLDDADEIALSVQKELLKASEEDEDTVAYELLSSLDARQLVTKIIARNRRSALRAVREKEAFKEAKTALAGKRGAAPCLTSIERVYPNIGDLIDEIVVGMDVGADAHRQDSALTFNSATKRAKGSGYVRKKTRWSGSMASKFRVYLCSFSASRVAGEAEQRLATRPCAR